MHRHCRVVPSATALIIKALKEPPRDVGDTMSCTYNDRAKRSRIWQQFRERKSEGEKASADAL